MIIKDYKGTSAIEDVVFYKGVDKHSLYCSEGFRINTGVSFKSSRLYGEVNTGYQSYTTAMKNFIPKTITLITTSTVGEIKDISRALRRDFDFTNGQFNMEMRYNGSKYIFTATYESDNINLIGGTNLCEYTIKLKTRTYYFKVESYTIDNTTPTTLDDGYEYDYDLPYGGENNSYNSSILPIKNYGELPAPVNVRIYDVAENPIVSVNAQYSETNNSIITEGVTNQSSDILHLKSINLENTYRIYQQLNDGSVVNQEQNRVFVNSTGYLLADKEESLLYFNNVNIAEVNVYVPFNNLN